MHARKLALALGGLALAFSATAQAHFVLVTPPPTNPADSIPKTVAEQAASNAASGKGGVPCGPDMMMAATPTPAQGGHPIMLKVVEVVPHDGFYRVALSINSRSELPPDNKVYDAAGKVLPSSGIGPDGKTLIGTSARADSEATPVFPVLSDNLFLHPGMAGPTYMTEITLPNVNCDHCTLQVLEFMHPHGYNGTPGKNDGGGYFYRHCADLKITADPAMPLFVAPGADGGTTDAGGAGAGGSAGVAGSTGTGGSTGAAGSAGAAGSTGSAGSTGASGATGGGGSTAAAGSTGAAGATGTAGVSGSTGGNSGTAGTQMRGGGGGCAVAGDGRAAGSIAFALFIAMGFLARLRRQKTLH
ncbi:MAG: hypothetical protein JWM82_2721 [Myxococcales bacterium]|nr:hypothetical protein [Myxococcales bacterium]